MTRKIISEFIPIFLLFLFIAYPKVFVPFSHTILGRLIAVLIIVFYSIIDITFGGLACVIVILYYQTDYAEGMTDISTLNDQTTSTESSTNSSDFKEPSHEVSTAPVGGVVNGTTEFSSAPSTPVIRPSSGSITNEKIKTETDIKTPKSSNDWASTVWKNIYALYKPTDPEDSVGVVTEPFSEYK